MAGLGSRFQGVDNNSNSMAAAELEEYMLASAEAAYQNSGKHVPVGFMDSKVESNKSGDAYHWLDQNNPFLPA